QQQVEDQLADLRFDARHTWVWIMFLLDGDSRALESAMQDFEAVVNEIDQVDIFLVLRGFGPRQAAQGMDDTRNALNALTAPLQNPAQALTQIRKIDFFLTGGNLACQCGFELGAAFLVEPKQAEQAVDVALQYGKIIGHERERIIDFMCDAG